MNKKQLAITLGMLEPLKNPSVKHEQYTTPANLAADLLWWAHMHDWLHGTLLDQGCGNGILGIAGALLGAKVTLIDNEPQAISTTQRNAKTLGVNVTCRQEIMGAAPGPFGVVLQNPPFGTRNAGVDIAFLENAFTLSNRVISIHKASTSTYVERVIKREGFKIMECWSYDFPLPHQYAHHTKTLAKTLVHVYFLEKAL